MSPSWSMTIVDMQGKFINPTIRQNNRNDLISTMWYNEAFERMVENIYWRASELLANGWRVLNTIYHPDWWWVIMPIAEVLDRYPEQVVTLLKHWEWLETADQEVIREFYSKLNWIDHDVVWIHTSSSVKSVAIDIKGLWVKPWVLKGHTLNFHPDTNLSWINEVDFIEWTYWEGHVDILRRWWISEEDVHLDLIVDIFR